MDALGTNKSKKKKGEKVRPSSYLFIYLTERLILFFAGEGCVTILAHTLYVSLMC